MNLIIGNQTGLLLIFVIETAWIMFLTIGYLLFGTLFSPSREGMDIFPATLATSSIMLVSLIYWFKIGDIVYYIFKNGKRFSTGG